MATTSVTAKAVSSVTTQPSALPQTTTGLDFSRAHFLTGIEALALLPVLQRVRDAAEGRNTAGFVSGYRGSPLGGLDQTLWEQKERLEAFHVTFQPGLNEDLAATAIWGTQQVGLFAGATYDGVFSLWYGKGPGVDRSMDVFKHANAAGTSPFGGVLAVAGDDHGAKSSTLPHQSEHMFAAAMMPVLNPAGVQDYIDFGLHGWAMSRYSGCWIGLKATADTVESAASVRIDPFRIKIILPDDELPPGGLNIRWPDAPMEQEYRLQRHKGYAAMSYARANGLNRIVMDSPKARLGIITTGKSYLDVRQALDDLGIDEMLAREIGLRVLKIGMSWPLNSEDVHDFAQGLEEILVVEEKRQLIEYQLKEQLYNWREDVRPKVIGKYDDKGEWTLPHVPWQLPAAGELSPAMIARVVASRLGRFYSNERIAARVAMIEAKERSLAEGHLNLPRTPHYCSGCPHNTSTLNLPKGSRALAGIGCHYMALWLDDGSTATFSQMGGEGVAWVGQAPFTETGHVFANLGDGTYTHSGILAIRQAISAGVSMTYKILYNDAVAMTGGQPLEQGLTVPAITRQLAAEGVVKIVIVSDEPEKYDGRSDLAPGTTVHHRRELNEVQETLRAIKGVTILVYDQTCAAEKRRRRRKGEYPDPLKRVFINDRVCEGCGDCSVKSNCMSVVGVETDYGLKRAIDQSSCNKDFSCAEGFCPSFVTVLGGRPRRGKRQEGGGEFGSLPDPVLPDLTQPYNILVTGVGGTGVVTIGAMIGRAAADAGLGVTVLDMAGLAQKGGPVWSHIRIAPNPEDLQATRIAMGEADVVLGCDEVVAIAADTLSRMQEGRTRAVINSDVSITSDTVRRFRAQGKSGDIKQFNDPDAKARTMEREIVGAVGSDNAEFIAATRLATKLMGDSIATNAFMLGFAWQKGLLPVGEAGLMQAIELQGVAVAATKAAFLWGRRAAHDRAAVEALALPEAKAAAATETFEALVERRTAELVRYQDEAYAKRYRDLVLKVAAKEADVARGSTRLAMAVARGYYKLLAYKDEYEVARLLTDPAFKAKLAEAFEGDYTIAYNLAPPILSKPDPKTGRIAKRQFGAWLEPVLRTLARFKSLRGSWLDVFRFSHDRRLDRALIADYEADIAQILTSLTTHNLDQAIALASLADEMRGYGPVKETYVAKARQRRDELLQAFSQGGCVKLMAAE
jgi:indolepyruvate ferredoxin oxidoreductase